MSVPAVEGTSDNISRRRRRAALAAAALLAILALSAVFLLMLGTMGPIGGSGARQMGFGEFLGALSGTSDELYRNVVLDARLPRIAMAILVGCALSASGTAMQALFRNPMADPFIIGVSGGAAVGAACAGLLALPFVLAGRYVIAAFAFAGAAIAVFSVVAIARGAGGRMRSETLLLSGVAVGSLLSALTGLAMYLSGNQFNSLFFWLLGSLNGMSWDAVWVAAGPVIAGLLVLQLFARDLNAITLGDETAMHLGIDVAGLKKVLLVTVAVLAGISVAFTGIIGFVGLIIPHMVRLAVGPDHRILLPAATLAGGAFLLWADAAARTVIQPTEIPLGIITALCGAPFFIYMLVRSGRPGGLK